MFKILEWNGWEKCVFMVQKEVAESIAELIVVNEEPKDWTKKVKAYVKKPVDQNLERVEKVQEIAVEHQVNTYLAGILYASKK